MASRMVRGRLARDRAGLRQKQGRTILQALGTAGVSSCGATGEVRLQGKRRGCEARERRAAWPPGRCGRKLARCHARPPKLQGGGWWDCRRCGECRLAWRLPAVRRTDDFDKPGRRV